MFAPNAYPPQNDKSSLQSGGIGPVLRLRLEEKRAFKETTQFKINKLDTQLRKMLTASASKSRRRETIEELDARMAQLEKQRVASSLKLAEEKKILREIEALQRLKKNEIEIQQIRNDLNTYRDIVHETNDAIIELESALQKITLSERLGCSTSDLREETITCPASKMSRVIGKNGSNIIQIERKTQVQIDVGDITAGEVGKIRLVGTESAIAEAIKEIENVTLAIEEEFSAPPALCAYLTSKRSAVLEKLRSEHPNVNIDVDLETNTIRLRGRVENIAEAKPSILAHDCKKEKILISKKDVGFVVGKGGSTLNKLETEHNVSIHVDSSDSAKDIASVEVVGLTPDVVAASAYLRRLLYENEDIEDTIMCTAGQKNMFIENSGAALKEIQSFINGQGGHSLIYFEKRDDESINTKAMVKLTIKSTRTMLPTVKRLVQERIDAYESSVVTIDVDPSIIPAIIGKGGETIKALEKTGAGATLEVEKGSSKVSVQSTDLATRLAVLEKIKEIVENNQTERLPINKNIIGQLLGEPGKDIRRVITDEIGAWMSLDDDESCIVIRGSKDKIAQAALLVEDFFKNNYQVEFDVAPDSEQLLFSGSNILTAVEKEHTVKATYNRSTSKVVIRGREDNVEMAKRSIEKSLYGSEDYSVSRMLVPERYTGVLVGKNGSNLSKLETDHGVSATLLRLNHELVLRGPPESVKSCRASVFKILATVNVNETVPISRVQYEELSKDNNMRSILDGINVNASLENTEVKLRGIEVDVKEAKSRIFEKLTGKYVAYIPLDVAQLNKLQKTTSFDEKLMQIGDSSKATLVLDTKECAIRIEGKRSNVKKAKLTVFKYLEFMLPSQFAKVTVSKQNLKSVADPACLASVAAETEAYLWLDRDLSCIHIRAADAKNVAAALKLLVEKKEESSKLIDIIELQPHEAWIVPKILGKGGATINGIRKSSGCKVDLMKDDLTITLSGEDSERAIARDLLDEVINKARKECQFVAIPVGAMNPFIGKGGANIKQVQEEYNVIIDCERDRSALRITGKEEAVANAVKAVNLWVQQWEEENSTKTLHIKESMLSAIVGKGGSVINSIQQETGCKVNIDRASSSVTVKGISRDLAVQRIQTIIENELTEQKARAAEKERQLKEAHEAEKERLRLAEEQSALLSMSVAVDGDEKKDEILIARAAPVGMSNSTSEEVLKPDPFVTPAGHDLFNFLMSDSSEYESDVVEKLLSNRLSKQQYHDLSAKGGMLPEDMGAGPFFISSSGVFVRL